MLPELWLIELFGGLRLRCRDRTISRFPTQKSASVLAYLALKPGTSHPRDYLAELIWPDAAGDSARHNLRQALLSLRRILEPPGTPTNSVIVADRLNVRLNERAVEADVPAFLSDVRNADAAGSELERLELLESACSRCSGPPLYGLYDDWAVAEREHIGQRVKDAFRAAAQIRTALGEYEQAAAHLRRAVAVDTLDEELRRLLIRVLMESGRVGDAARAVEDARSTWRRELGSDLPASIAAIEPELNRESTAAPSARPKSRPGTHPSPSTPKRGPRLPLPLTRFFGRTDVIERISGLLTTDSPARLVTLTGPGGSGKTRTALESARALEGAFADRLHFVPLADVSEAALILDGILSHAGIERGIGDLFEQVIHFLGGQRTLLLLDNLEHLEGAGEIAQALLSAAPSLQILATSRAPLGIAGERCLPLPPLAVPSSPGTPERLTEFPSVEMFVDRAQQVKPDFQITPRNAEAIAAVCERLEGIPLAIELAAARASILTPARMLEELNDRFSFLTGRESAFPERHRSLRAALESSMSALTPDLRRMFTQVSIFRGGWTLEAMAAVCIDGPVMYGAEELQRQSLIAIQETSEDIRFAMLETVRDYASEVLDAEESRLLSERHAAYYMELARRYAEGMNSPEEYELAESVARDHDNIRASLRWLLDSDPVQALEMLNLLQRFHYVRGFFEEAQRLNELAIERTEGLESFYRARAYNSAGVLARERGDLSTALAHCRKAREMALRVGHASAAAFALHSIGLVQVDLGDYQEGIRAAEQALIEFRSAGIGGFEIMALNLLAHAHHETGDLDRADSYSALALKACEQHANKWLLATVLNSRGAIRSSLGHCDEATQLFSESLRLAREIESRRGEALALYNWGMTCLRHSEQFAAAEKLRECLAIFEDLGDRGGVTFTLEGVSFLILDSAPESAARLIAAVERFREAFAVRRPPVDEPLYSQFLESLQRKIGIGTLDGIRAAASSMQLSDATRLARSHFTPLIRAFHGRTPRSEAFDGPF